MHRKALENLIKGTAKDVCVWGGEGGGQEACREDTRITSWLYRPYTQ